ncbi:MAG: cellulase family glycosylhydrolase [Verrucomicrobia bacterium]|nr:cellulase family glycosylhydrolase [Verrucomicrobiota bacterium]
MLITGFLATGAELSSKPGSLPRLRIAADGRGFETEQGKPFVPFGVNYFRPGQGWAPQLWKKFDAEATRKDFALMKQFGVNCVRVFLTYGSFLTETNRVSPEALATFDEFLALAEEAGIYVHPTGPDHWEGLPPWAKGDRIADEVVLGALEEFWKLFAARYRNRSVLFAYDLLNEPEVKWDTSPMRQKWNRWLEKKYTGAEQIAQSWGLTNQNLNLGSIPIPPKEDCAGCKRLLDFQHFREDTADEWTRRQVAAIKSADPRALVTVGLIQWSVPSAIAACWHYSAFRPERQARFLDFMEIHFYPLANGHYEYQNEEEEAKNLAYLEGVVREVARFNKPVIIAEFGWYGGGKLNYGNHAPATEEQQSQWCRKLVESTAGLACGWLNWGFYDQPEAGDVSQLLGLVKANGETKAWGREFKQLAARYAERKLPPPQLGPRPAMDWDLCITSAAKGATFRSEYLKAWRERR